MGRAAVLAVIGLGTVVPATVAGRSARAAAGSSCNHPLTWNIPPRQIRTLFGNPFQTYRHQPSGGPVIGLEVGHYYGYDDVIASISARGWRICALSSRPPRSKVVAPVSSMHETDRAYLDRRPSAMSIAYALRDRARDGASCANPYVVVATDDHVGDLKSQEHGDRFAGSVQITTTLSGANQRTGHDYARWHANPGYHTCHASALTDDSHQPWNDFRPSGARFLSTWDVPAHHGFRYIYVYATFARSN